MRVDSRVLAILLKLRLVVAAIQADFKNIRAAMDVEQDGPTLVVGLGKELQPVVQVSQFDRPWGTAQNLERRADNVWSN
jgi:hypothetical protein